MNLAPNARLQLTGAAQLLQSARRWRSPLCGFRRPQLKRKPLDDTRSGECGVKSSPSRAPRLDEPGETRRIRAATPVPPRRVKSSLSSNTSLHRTPAAQLSSFSFGIKPAPVSSNSLDGTK